jgi:hypothetical protein
MRRKLRRTIEVVAAILAASHLSGCTLIGYTIGRDSDTRVARAETYPIADIEGLRPGTDANLVTRGGRLFSGRYQGLVPVDEAEYARRYALARQSARIPLPAIGELILVFAGPERVEGRFRGFDYDRIALEPGNGGEPWDIELASLDSLVNGDGQSLYRTALRRYVWQGWLPLLSAVSLRTDNGASELVPRESLAYLERLGPRCTSRGVLLAVIGWPLWGPLLAASACGTRRPTRYTTHPIADIEGLDRGEHINALTESLQLFSGRYEGLVPVDEAEYAQRYARAQASAGIPLPELGEPIVVFAAQRQVQGSFQGFSFERIALEPGDGTGRREIEIASVDSLVNARGESVDGATLRRYVWQGWLPQLYAVSLRTYDGRLVVAPRERLTYLQTALGGKARQGLLIGLAIDAAIIATVAVVCGSEHGRCSLSF